MKNNLHVFLGATVADAAARPLHWVYNQKKLQTYNKGKKDFTFLKKKNAPRYLYGILRLLVLNNRALVGMQKLRQVQCILGHARKVPRA